MVSLLLSYVALNAVALAMFGVDKGMAVGGGRRISERKLLAAALFGPFGAYAGMKLFKHKTRKLVFYFGATLPYFALDSDGLLLHHHLKKKPGGRGTLPPTSLVFDRPSRC